MAIADPSWRWERWLEFAQIQLLKNFTQRGWGLGTVPAGLHARVQQSFRDAMAAQGRKRPEGAIAGYVQGSRDMISLAAPLQQEVISVFREQIAAWAGYKPAELDLTSLYGIRVYYKNSTLATHVDRVQTHVLSAIYVVDDAETPGAEPWHVVTDPDITGVRKAVKVAPGQLFFYESAKLPHGRPSALQKDFSAHMFCHFSPRGWHFANEDRVYALPEYWNSKSWQRKEL